VQQQSVLFLATRGPDGAQKYHPCKDVQRAYRATVMTAARYGRMIDYGEHVDNFMSLKSFADDGQWEIEVDNFFNNIDSIPHHFVMKLLHATEILGYKHPDLRFRERWLEFYQRGVYELHLHPETHKQLDLRLSDWSRAHWPGGLYVDHSEGFHSRRTQNEPEDTAIEVDAPGKTYDPNGKSCECQLYNFEHPQPLGFKNTERRLCNGKRITMAWAVMETRTQNGPE
jgi:hypothetical protein